MKVINVYRLIGVCFFTIVILSHSIQKIWIVSDYFIHTNQYAEVCVNKEKPKLHCNGKCKMLEKIEEVDRQQKDSSPKDNLMHNMHEIHLFFEGCTLNESSDLPIDQKPNYFMAVSAPEGRVNTIFHPPMI